MDQHRTDELLLYCLRINPDKTRSARLEQLSIHDWNDVIQQSIMRGITPLLYHCLKTFYPDTPIPIDVMEKLRHSYLQNAFRNRLLYHLLGKVLKRLRHDNIQVIPLKGAHLAEHIYGNIALRPMGDVDLLVHKADLLRVEAALLGIGFTSLEYNRVVRKDNRHFHYVQPKWRLHVEIHWNILAPMYPFNIDPDGLWERSRAAMISGFEVSVLCPEDLLLHLCLQNSEHAFEMGIRSVCDVSETLRHYRKEIDWKQIRLCVRQWGIERCVYLNLRIARELLGTAVPDEMLEAITPYDFDERFMALAKEQIFPTRVGTLHGLPLSPNITQLWGPKRFLDKVTLFLKSTFPSPEVMSRMYPPSSDSLRIYFYYVIRLKYLLLRHGQAMWRLLCRNKEMLIHAGRKNEGTALKEWLMSG